MAVPSECLLLGAAYKCTYLLIYFQHSNAISTYFRFV